MTFIDPFADAVKLSDVEYHKHLKKLELMDRIHIVLGVVFTIAFVCAVVVSIIKA